VAVKVASQQIVDVVFIVLTSKNLVATTFSNRAAEYVAITCSGGYRVARMSSLYMRAKIYIILQFCVTCSSCDGQPYSF